MQDLITFMTNHPILTVATVLVVMLLMIIELMRARKGVFCITPALATQKINHDNAVVIDIRSPEQFQKGHIIDAISLSTKDISENPKKVEKYRARPLIIICGTGTDSQKLAAHLLKNGYNSYALAGGIRAWTEAQLPLIH